MKKLTQEILAIEEIRRRAKDNKAKNVSIFVKSSEDYLEKTRNILFLVSFSILGYLGAVQKLLTYTELFLLVVSISFGLISYFFSYLHSLSQARYYADLEKNLSEAFPNQKEYEDVLSNEKIIRVQHSKRDRYQTIAVILMIIQAFQIIVSFIYLSN